MRLSIFGTALALLACPLVVTAAAVNKATAATAAINATSPFPVGRWQDIRWDYIGAGTDLLCQLSVIWYDYWKEYAQDRHRVFAEADIGNIANILDLDDKQTAEYEKLLLEAWVHFWWQESVHHEHPGDNFSAWIERRAKTERWEGYADSSTYSIAEGRAQYIGHNVGATKRWQAWTLGRCTVWKDF